MLNKVKSLIFSSNDAKEVTINSFWSVVGTFFSKGLAFLGWVLVANLLGKELNGEIGIVRSTINLFLIFVGSGLGLTATRYIAENKKQNLTTTGNIVSLTLLTTLIFGFLIGVSFYIFSEELAVMLNAPQLEETLELGAFLLFFGGFNGSLKGCLEGFQLFKQSAIVNIIFSIALFLGLYLGAKLQTPVSTFIGFLAATVFYFILQAVLLVSEFKKRKLKFGFQLKEELPILSKFTIPAILSGAMVIPFKWITEALLVNQPNGYNEMGLFSAIILFQALLYMFAQTFNAPLITIMSKKEKSDKINKISLLLPWAIGIFGALPFIFFPELFKLIFGKEYAEDPNFFNTYLIILISTVIMLYKQGIARIMVLKKMMWLSFLDNFIWGVTLLISFYFLVYEGSLGLAIAYLISYAINIIVIIPLYLKWKFISKTLIFSPYAILLWVLLIVITLLNYFFPFLSLLVKTFLVILSSIIFFYLFYKLFDFDEFRKPT